MKPEDAADELKRLIFARTGIIDLNVIKVAELYYPIMLTQTVGEISESKACELLGMNVEKYRETKEAVIKSVLALIHSLPSPLILLLDTIPDRQKSSTKKG